MPIPDEYPITGTAQPQPILIDFGFLATDIYIQNDGSVSFYWSVKGPDQTGSEVKPGDSLSMSFGSGRGLYKIWVKTTSSTAAYHGSALRL